MNTRICPKCNAQLNNYDYYFCSNCGQPLPKELVNLGIPIKVKNYTFVSEPSPILLKLKSSYAVLKTHVFNKDASKYYILACLILVLGIGINIIGGYIYKNIIKKPTNSKSVNINGNQKNVITSNLPLTPNSFGQDSIAEYVPANCILFVEINGLKTFESSIPDIVKTQSANIDNYELLSKLLSDHVGIFAVKNNDYVEWGVISYTNPEIKELIENEADLNKYWKYKNLESVVILATNESIFKMVSDSNSRYNLNLSLSPKYVLAKSRVPSEGKVQVMAFSDEGLKLIETLKGYSDITPINDILDQVVKSGYNEVVIN